MRASIINILTVTTSADGKIDGACGDRELTTDHADGGVASQLRRVPEKVSARRSAPCGEEGRG